jgi:hypothetical protein
VHTRVRAFPATVHCSPICTCCAVPVCCCQVQLKRCQVPGVLLPLHGIEGSSVELIAAAADADGRAAMYGKCLPGLALASPILVCCLLCVSTQGFVFGEAITRLTACNASFCG